MTATLFGVFGVCVALAAATPAPTAAVSGAAVDAMLVTAPARAPEIWVSTSEKGGRHLVRLDRTAAVAADPMKVPSGAIFVDVCPGGRVVFSDAHGVVDTAGARLVDAAGLFTIPDAQALFVGDLCGKAGSGAGELRFPTIDGVAVRRAGDTATTPQMALQLAHEARAYSGRVHRGLRPDRGYAEALSLYGPRFIDVDVDGDGDTDLVAVREGRITAWRRGPGGVLEAAPAADRDLETTLGVGDDADLRVRLVDVNSDGRADAVIGVTRGAVPERSEAWLVSSTGDQLFSTPRRLWKKDGLVAAIGNRGKGLVMAEIDTSLMSLSAVLLTGRIPVKVGLEGNEPLAMQAKVDVRAGRMDGALPVVNVDFDKDGIPDLLDLGEPGVAALHLGTPTGFALDAAVAWSVPAFVHVIAMPELPGVVLIGAPAHGKTTVAVLIR